MTKVRPPYTVLYLDNSRTWGGGINTLVDLVSALDRSIVEPVVASAQPVDFLQEAFSGIRVKPFRTPVQWESRELGWLRRGGTVGGPPMSRLMAHSRAAYWLARHHLPAAVRIAALARDVGADLIHLNNNAASQIDGILAARVLGTPCVAHAHGRQRSRWFLRKIVRYPAVHVAISEEIRQNLLSLGIEPDRIALIPPGIDLSKYETRGPRPGLRAELALTDEAQVFALFGRLVPWKGIVEFVDAAARVCEAMPDAVCLIVGDESDGERAYAERVRRRIADLGMASRIRLTGFRDDVPELMRLADCVVHASTKPEPFGLVVVEAMAVGTPVVAADSGGPRETIVPGETGLLVDPRDPEALAGAILAILRDPQLGRTMGRAAASRVQNAFSKERYARELEALYESILSGTFPPRASS